MTDGCVHIQENSRWKFHQLAARQLLSGQLVRYGKARRYDRSITYKITRTPVGSISSSQPGGPPCWASPQAFGLIGCSPPPLPLRQPISLLTNNNRAKMALYWSSSLSMSHTHTRLVLKVLSSEMDQTEIRLIR
jgi:hypothetical protein